MDNQPTNEVPVSNPNPSPKSNSPLIILVIILSFLFGSLGGAFGFVAAQKNPQFAKSVGGTTTVNQQVSLSEDSAIINVVKQDSPAVVSIIISQNVSQLPGYGLSPFGNDPFFNFFFNNGQSQQQAPSSGLQEVGAGSGFFISSDGLIVTNKHVVQDTTASYTVITQDGKKYDATVQSRDPVNDLAIVKINIKNAPHLDLADSGSLQVGQRVIAIGNSLGQYQNTVTSGIISGIGRKITAGSETGTEDLSNVIQTDAAINPGNSGGPLLDITGHVVGINTAIDQQGQLVGFAIPSNEINKDIVSFQKSGKITRPLLGVRYVIVTSDIAQQQHLSVDHGALLVAGQSSGENAIVSGSPADKAGLKEGDIILQVNGKDVTQDSTLSDLLNQYNPGDSVTLQVNRSGKNMTVTVTLGEA